MKVLILSNTPWDNSNSFGNTFSNFFDGIEGIEIANIFCQSGAPRNDLEMRCFQISEKSLIRHLKDRKNPSGHEVDSTDCSSADALNSREQRGLAAVKKIRLRLFIFAREFLWRIGGPISPELKAFVDDFDADVIFQPIYDSNHMVRLARFLIEYTGKPAVGFIGDDLYTLKRFELSPLFWIDRLQKRPKIRRLIKSCSSIFVMTELQKNEYDRIFGVDCRILTKGADFDGEPPLKAPHEPPYVFTYTGSVYMGRWKALAKLGEALDSLNARGFDSEFRIYTTNSLTGRMKKAFDRPSVKLMGGAPASEMPRIQAEADALVFADGNTKRSRGLVRHSFSTKLVDYMKAARCIFAIGPEGIAPIDHLKKYNAALVAARFEDVLPAAESLLKDPGLFAEYGRLAWECGRSRHSRSVMQGRIKEELTAAIERGGG